MKALITGGAGFIGSYLSEFLLEEGHHVRIIDDLSTGAIENIEHLKNNKRFECHIGSILNESLLNDVMDECDIVYHLAAAVGVRLIIEKPVHTIRTNILGTENVFNAACSQKKRVIIASTSEIYGKNLSTPFKEDDDMVFGNTTRSRWGYACSKAIDEFLGLAYRKEKDLNVVVLRFFNTVGPRQTGRYGMVIPRFVQQALSGQALTVYGDGAQTRSFCYVKDCVKAISKISQYPNTSGEIFNIGSPEEISIKHLAEKIVRLSNSRSEIKYIPYKEAFTHDFEDMQQRVPDISKINKWIGFEPKVKLDQIIVEVVEYYRNRNKI